ncbi:MAG: ribulose-phosphate 3-epimerase [Opitutales bacterium]
MSDAFFGKSRPRVLAPSILAGDHADLAGSLAEVEGDGRRWVHVDVMDGHFVPNVTFGSQTVADLRRRTEVFLDVHLMMEAPHKFVEAFAEAGSDLISIHIEPNYDHAAALSRIRSLGKRTGIVLNPDTPPESVFPYLEQVDLVLCMTVQPGFGGQAFKPEVLDKVGILYEHRETEGHSYLIEVDGGVTPENLPQCADAGVDVFVAGTAYYKADAATRKAFAELAGEAA